MIRFYGEQLSAPRPTPKLEDHPLSAARDCLFNIFAATLHIGGRSSIRSLRTRYALGTGNLREGDHFGNPGVDGRIILRWIFRKWDVGNMDGIELAQDKDRWRTLVSAVMNLRVP